MSAIAGPPSLTRASALVVTGKGNTRARYFTQRSAAGPEHWRNKHRQTREYVERAGTAAQERSSARNTENSADNCWRRSLVVHSATKRKPQLCDVVARGHKVPAVRLWVKGEPQARISFEEVGADLTPYSFLQIFPQDEHEQLLITTLEGLGVSVERNTELLGYSDEGGCVIARLQGPDEQEERCEAACIVGCDGAHSIVRETMGTGYPGGTYRHLFYVADVEASGPAIDGELHVDLEEADFLAVFPLAGKGRARLIGTVRDDRADTLKFEDVSGRVVGNLKVDVEKVNWFSTYRVHHRPHQARAWHTGRSVVPGRDAGRAEK
jgi:FAD binding domain